jgi:hypothetical protein
VVVLQCSDGLPAARDTLYTSTVIVTAERRRRDAEKDREMQATRMSVCHVEGQSTRASCAAIICHFPSRLSHVSVHTRHRRSWREPGSGATLDSDP